MSSNPNPTCPKCKQADQVQKLSDVYDANTQEWSEQELGMDVFGHIEDRQIAHEAHTRLGLKLEPPEEPTPPNSPALWYWIGIAIIIIILASLCPVVVVPLAIAIPVLLSNAPNLTGRNKEPEWHHPGRGHRWRRSDWRVDCAGAADRVGIPDQAPL